MGQPDHGLPRVYKQAVRNQGLVPAAWGLCQELFAVVAFACAVQAALPQWPVLLSFCGCFSSLGHTCSLAQQASKQQQLIHSCGASVWQSGCEGGGHCGAFTMLQSLSCYIYVCVCPVLLMFMFWGVLTQASSILEFVNQSGRLVARGEAIDFSTV